MKKTIPLLGLSLVILTACGGGGGGGSDDPPPEPSRVSISGTISTAANSIVDSDVNDPFTSYSDNSTFATAQLISNTVSVQGFLTSSPTSFSGDVFAGFSDINDMYQVSLQAGQQIFMQVIDHSSFSQNSNRYSGDLDLALYDANQQLISTSDSTTEFETITVTTDGTYYVVPYAYSGASKYILQVVTGTNATSGSQSSADFVPGEAIVKMAGNNRLRSANSILTASKISHKQSSERASLARFDQPTAGANRRLALTGRPAQHYSKLETLIRIKELRQSPGVEYAVPNYIYQPMRVPNDEFYNYQWHYQSMNLPQAWDITTGTPGNNQDVIVAVVDTGVVPHPDLEGQLVPGFDFISDPSNALDGDGIDNNADDPGDSTSLGRSSWHGTHVAGTVAARSDNDRGVAGVSWGAKIMPVRVLGRVGGTQYDILQGIRFAAGMNNDSNTVPAQRADIINLSLGGSNYSPDIERVYREIYDSGVIIVAAAGNDNSSSLKYPASYDGVISVSALDFNHERAPYSNFGTAIDIGAPGGDITVDLSGDGRADGVLSTLIDDSSGQRKAVYSGYQGTSMAAPHVAGMIALMKAIHPALTPTEVDALLAAGDLTQDAGTPGRDNIYGHGRADALRAVQAAQRLAGGGTPPALPPSIVSLPSALNLSNQNAGVITLSNNGGGSPTFLNIVENAPWLTVTADQTDAQGLGTYTARVNRADLSAGLYTENVTFNFSDNVSVQVNISMLVNAPDSDGELGQLYPLLYDPDANNGDGVVVAQATTTTVNRGLITYTFSNIAPGSYYVIAGTDIDNDGLICQIGEGCGAFPSITQLGIVDVQDEDIRNLDFIVDVMASLSSDGASVFGGNTKKTYEFKRLDK